MYMLCMYNMTISIERISQYIWKGWIKILVCGSCVRTLFVVAWIFDCVTWKEAGLDLTKKGEQGWDVCRFDRRMWRVGC